MKVAVITRHAIPNYGSLLQAMATQQVIENLGYECQIIDYIRDDESYYMREKTLLKRKDGWNKNPLKRALYMMLRQPTNIVVGKKFEEAQKKNLNLTERYTSAEQLVNNLPIADVYMTGSDQVWGTVENGEYDSSYCLSFVPNEKKKIAYAASFGHTKMNDESNSYFQKWLSKYRHIAVREDSAVKILENLDIRSMQVLDPTLLLDASYWKRFTTTHKNKKYVLVYQLHNDKKLGVYAKKVAKAKGLSLVRISVAFHQIMREGKLVWVPKWDSFLSYIQNAECMITDSFHGTAFAINFNTPFVEVLPNNHTGTRNMSLIRLTGLSERILKNDDDVELASKKIDFSFANSILSEKRKESIAVLRQMIEC